jgi:hypothetical protein
MEKIVIVIIMIIIIIVVVAVVIDHMKITDNYYYKVISG